MVLLSGFDDGRHRLLDAQVDHGVTVVRDDDVDQVLADVMDITLDGCQYQGALARAGLRSIHVRLQIGDCLLHRLRALQHERQLHLT
ncbi:hypothetical protein SDC9_163717 [bioreactor metagenome]|uniref:Uncharacterized protein n=1 Tax=bioreactor metagenome TaxID=1076179 RepID=A0A645FPL8_9ZZZZ